MDVFDHVDVKDLVCSYCEHKHDVPHEIMDYKKEQETQIIKCSSCKKQFKTMVDFDPRYTTEAMEEDDYLENV